MSKRSTAPPKARPRHARPDAPPPTGGARLTLPQAPKGDGVATQGRRRGKGTGALLVWCQDRGGQLDRRVGAHTVRLYGGHLYPLPCRTLQEVLAADGREIHKADDDPKGLGWHYQADATPLTDKELESISRETLSGHRQQLEIILGMVRREIDATSGPGTYDRLWKRGAGRARLPDNTPCKRAGSAGSLHEVREFYFAVVPKAARTLTEIPALTPKLPACIQPLDGDPLFCGKCGGVQPSLGALTAHQKVVHEQRATLHGKRKIDDMPGTVIEQHVDYLGDALQPKG